MSSFSKLTEHRGSNPGASYKWAGAPLNSGHQVIGDRGHTLFSHFIIVLYGADREKYCDSECPD